MIFSKLVKLEPYITILLFYVVNLTAIFEKFPTIFDVWSVKINCRFKKKNLLQATVYTVPTYFVCICRTMYQPFLFVSAVHCTNLFCLYLLYTVPTYFVCICCTLYQPVLFVSAVHCTNLFCLYLLYTVPTCFVCICRILYQPVLFVSAVQCTNLFCLYLLYNVPTCFVCICCTMYHPRQCQPTILKWKKYRNISWLSLKQVREGGETISLS